MWKVVEYKASNILYPDIVEILIIGHRPAGRGRGRQTVATVLNVFIVCFYSMLSKKH